MALCASRVVSFEFDVDNQGDDAVRCVVDYAVGYPGVTGGARRKVFKFTEVTIAARSAWRAAKRQAMKQVSIRALFPGEHTVSLLVNGVVLATATFDLRA